MAIKLGQIEMGYSNRRNSKLKRYLKRQRNKAIRKGLLLVVNRYKGYGM